MEGQFFMGIKNNVHNLLKHLLIIILMWAIICTVLVKVLFGYYESYVQREDSKIIYEIKSSVLYMEAQKDVDKIQ